MGILSQLAKRAGFANPVDYDRHRRKQSGYLPQRLRPIPENEQGWQERYNWLWDWYSGMPYATQDVKYLRLFRAVDTSGETIVMAERLTRDAQFVVDTDVHALAGGRWSLEPSGNTGTGLLRAGEGVWRRSDLQAQRAGWLRAVCSMGDLWLEAVLDEDGRAKLVAYDPRHCTPTYSADGLRVLELYVRIPYIDIDETPRVYTRTITPTRVEAAEINEDGVEVPLPGQSGEHGLGVAPVVHLRCQPIVGIHEHSLWSGHGLDRYTAAMDSLYAQLRAIGQRYAHPHLVAKGFQFRDETGDAAGIEQMGRIYDGIPADADLSYLEAGMGAIAPLMDTIHRYGEDVRATIPEFTLAGSGANTSGRALEFRADQFRRKMSDLATRTHEPIALATQYAVEMERQREHNPSRRLYRIGAPPPLPVDRPQHLTMVQSAYSAGLIDRVTAVRHMQAIGMVDEEADAEDYAAGLDSPPTTEPPPDSPPIDPATNVDTGDESA